MLYCTREVLGAEKDIVADRKSCVLVGRFAWLLLEMLVDLVYYYTVRSHRLFVNAAASYEETEQHRDRG